MAPLADVLRDRPDEYSSAPEKYFFGQRMGAPGMSAQQEAYELQKQYAAQEIGESFLQPDDAIPVPGKTFLQALKHGGGMLALGALMPKGKQAETAVSSIRKALHPAFLNRVEATTPRAGATVIPKQQPLEDVGVYVGPKLTSLLKEPTVAESTQSPLGELGLRVARGMVHRPVAGRDKTKPWMGLTETGLEIGTPVHEATHLGFPSLRPNTAEVLRKSFVRRKDELTDKMKSVGDTTGLRYLNNLANAGSASNAPDKLTPQQELRAVEELLARLLQGKIEPSGPERHLLSPAGRAIASDVGNTTMDLVGMMRRMVAEEMAGKMRR